MLNFGIPKIAFIMLAGMKRWAIAVHQRLVAVQIPVETVHRCGLRRKINDAASAAKPVLS